MSRTCPEITCSPPKLSVRKAFDKMNAQSKKIDAPPVPTRAAPRAHAAPDQPAPPDPPPQIFFTAAAIPLSPLPSPARLSRRLISTAPLSREISISPPPAFPPLSAEMSLIAHKLSAAARAPLAASQRVFPYEESLPASFGGDDLPLPNLANDVDDADDVFASFGFDNKQQALDVLLAKPNDVHLSDMPPANIFELLVATNALRHARVVKRNREELTPETTAKLFKREIGALPPRPHHHFAPRSAPSGEQRDAELLSIVDALDSPLHDAPLETLPRRVEPMHVTFANPLAN